MKNHDAHHEDTAETKRLFRPTRLPNEGTFFMATSVVEYSQRCNRSQKKANLQFEQLSE